MSKHPVTSMTIEPMPQKPSSEEIAPPTPSGSNKNGTERLSPEPKAGEGWRNKVEPAIEHGEDKDPGKDKLISLKKGGKVPKTGPYKLHKDEVVIPANKVKTMKAKMDAATKGLGTPDKGEKSARVKKSIHMTIEPTDNKGFIVKHHEHENGMPTGKVKHHAFAKTSDLHKHVQKTFPMPAAEQAAPAPDAAAAPAPNAAPAPAPAAAPAAAPAVA